MRWGCRLSEGCALVLGHLTSLLIKKNFQRVSSTIQKRKVTLRPLRVLVQKIRGAPRHGRGPWSEMEAKQHFVPYVSSTCEVILSAGRGARMLLRLVLVCQARASCNRYYAGPLASSD